MAIVDSFCLKKQFEQAEIAVSNEDSDEEISGLSDERIEEELSDLSYLDVDEISVANEHTEFGIDFEYSNTIIKVRRISLCVKNSCKMRWILKSYTKLVPMLDVKKRWSSLAKMLERFEKILPDLRKAYIDASKPFNIVENDAKSISVLSKLLSPGFTNVKKLSNAKANLLTADREVTALLNTLSKTQFDFDVLIKNSFIDQIKNQFISRRTRVSDVIQYLLQKKFNPEKICSMCSRLTLYSNSFTKSFVTALEMFKLQMNQKTLNLNCLMDQTKILILTALNLKLPKLS